MRQSFYGVARDGNGTVIAGAQVRVFLGGTDTPVAMYVAQLGGGPVDYVTTDSDGQWVFWLDLSAYIEEELLTPLFKIVVSKSGFVTQTIDNIFLNYVYNYTAALSGKADKGVTLPASTKTSTGFYLTGTYGENCTFGQAIYLKAADGKWWKARANAMATLPCTAIAGEDIDIGVEADGKVLLAGGNQFVRLDTWSWTRGSLLYVSTATAGAVTHTAPTTGNFGQVIGVAIATNTVQFNPSPVIVEVV